MNKSNKYPEIVYKYRNWKDKYHKNVLRKNELYMSSPKDLNDPFDCRIPTNFTLLNTQETKACYAHFQCLFYSKEIQLQGSKYNDTFPKILDDLQDINQYQKNYEEILFNAQNDDYAILSLSGRWDSIAMWSHYGDQHKGYCVGFYEEKMRNSKIFGMGGPVHYNKNDGFPLIRPYEWGMEKLFKMSHTKAKEWKYEKEYRLTDLLNREGENIPKSRVRPIPDGFIAEIVIGLMTPQNHKQEILKIASKKSIKVYQTEKVPFKFKIKRTRIL